ncbi:MAG: lipid A export permease/ATP-binding protein MsbA [Gammaproteobacteria bacterium]
MKQKGERASDLGLYLRLLRYVRPYWRMFLLTLLAMILLAATDPAIPALLKPMLDGAFIEKDPDTMIEVPLLLILLFAVRGLSSYTSGMCLNWTANKVIMDIREQMFAKLLVFPGEFYDRHNAGSLISKFTYDVTRIGEASSNALTAIVKDSLSIIGLLIWMLYINWQMTSLTILSAPLIMLVVITIRRRLRKMSSKLQDTMADINHVLSECIDGQQIIKLFGGQRQEAERFWQTINSNRRFTMKFVAAAVATGPVIQLITAVVLALIVYIAARQAVAGELSVGAFVSFFTAAGLLLAPLKRLVRVNEHIQRGLAACESVFAMLDEPGESDTGNKGIPKIKGEIEVRNLSHLYGDTGVAALNNISLHIDAGETVALVGPSGCGKTTFARMIPLFYGIGEGKIFIDGHDVQQITLSELRSYLALVSQDVVLFNDTIRNNIAYGGMREADDEAIIFAAKQAHAMEFINKLPAGLDTVIGEKGARLSLGQRQRLSLARALLKDAPILILDEATSSLDTESEYHIQKAIEEVRKGRTCIIIAHRLSTIRNADKIFVLENGKIIEAGDHQQLLKQDGLYAKLLSAGFK